MIEQGFENPDDALVSAVQDALQTHARGDVANPLHDDGVAPPTPLYRYDKAASAFKLDRRSAGVDAPRRLAPGNDPAFFFFSPSCCAYVVRPRRPSVSKSWASSLNFGFGVVRSTSPLKMEFAPAMNMSACSPLENSRRPAERRTMVLGRTMRAAAKSVLKD